MADAHASDYALPVPECRVLRVGGDEGGFSLIELIVVLIIVSILMAVGIFGFRAMRDSSTAPQMNTGAGRIWRAVQDYRFDNEGAFPTAAMLTSSGGASFVDLGGRRYVRIWPDGVKGAKYMIVQSSAAAAAPTTGPVNVVLYHTAGSSGWMAAYDANGKRVFQRGVSPTASPVVPLG